MLKLFNFHGGLQLPRHKQVSLERPVATASLPEQLIYPLQLRPGVRLTATVQPGERVLAGQVIADSEHFLATPVHAASSGVVRGIVDWLAPHPSGLPDHAVVIDTDGLEQAVAPMPGLDYRHETPATIKARIRQAGVVGLGGAAFSTAVKLNPGPNRVIDTLILNGAECEPYITCDNALMQTRARAVVEGALILLHALQIGRCLIAVEDHMTEALAALDAVLAEVKDRRLSRVAVPSVYPTGGERQLIKVLTGKEAPSGGIPADVGIVCQNVGTAAAIYDAVVNGLPLTWRLVTVTGKGVARPSNWLARIGTPIADLIEQSGGYTPDVRRLIIGGPMMGFALPDDVIPIAKASNCILAAALSEVDVDRETRACIRCGECANACPVNLLPQQLYWYSRVNNLDKLKQFSLFDCIECGCCEVVCPSHIPLVNYYRAAKSKTLTKAKQAEKAAIAKRRHDANQERKAREQAEKAERARARKAALAAAKQQEQPSES
ncbi:MAG: electron transport complex subunit RsxC [Methylococcales bacterium]|nr:electron transport complex subunit RsxC [Methylococcales bacterium]